MKPSEKILTYEQAKELKWFCKNCVGLRMEYYELRSLLDKRIAHMDRLQKTCDLIEKFFKDHPEEEVDREQESV